MKYEVNPPSEYNETNERDQLSNKHAKITDQLIELDYGECSSDLSFEKRAERRKELYQSLEDADQAACLQRKKEKRTLGSIARKVFGLSSQ